MLKDLKWILVFCVLKWIFFCGDVIYLFMLKVNVDWRCYESGSLLVNCIVYFVYNYK